MKEWSEALGIATTCDLCGSELFGDDRVLMHALISALLIPERDEARNADVYNWPGMPLRRKRICKDCFDPKLHMRFAGLEKGPFVIAQVLPDGARRGYCRTCGDARVLYDGESCSKNCADALVAGREAAS